MRASLALNFWSSYSSWPLSSYHLSLATVSTQGSVNADQQSPSCPDLLSKKWPKKHVLGRLPSANNSVTREEKDNHKKAVAQPLPKALSGQVDWTHNATFWSVIHPSPLQDGHMSPEGASQVQLHVFKQRYLVTRSLWQHLEAVTLSERWSVLESTPISLLKTLTTEKVMLQLSSRFRVSTRLTDHCRASHCRHVNQRLQRRRKREWGGVGMVWPHLRVTDRRTSKVKSLIREHQKVKIKS